MGDLLGGDPVPGADELRGIVARARRHHRRVAGLGMAVTLAVGAAAGLVVARPPGRVTATTAGSTSAASAQSSTRSGAASPSGSSSGSAAIVAPPQGPLVLTALFTRTTGAVTIRGFAGSYQPSGVEALPACGYFGGPRFQAELSTAKMVGDAYDRANPDRSKPLSAVAATVVGEMEHDPTVSVTAATGSTVAAVRMAFAGGGTDEMAPVQGWVSLAAPYSGQVGSTTPLGTLTAVGASGQVLATTTVTVGSGFGPVPLAVACPVPSCPSLESPLVGGTSSTVVGRSSNAPTTLGSGSGVVVACAAGGCSVAPTRPATCTGPLSACSPVSTSELVGR